MHIEIDFISHFNNKWPCARILINEKIIFENFCIGDEKNNFNLKNNLKKVIKTKLNNYIYVCYNICCYE